MNFNARAERLSFTILGIMGLLFLLAPMAIVMLASLDPSQFFNFPPQDISNRWFLELIRDESWRSSVVLTLAIAALSAVASAIVGGLTGIAVARLSARARSFAYPFLVAPLIVPVIVLAISFYVLALRFHLVGNLMAFVAANTILTAPLVALFVSGACLRLDHRIELASLSCGASPTRTLMQITFPLVGPTAMAGGALAFLLALDEVIMSVFLVAPGKTPLAVKLFLQAQTGTASIVMAASTVLILSSLVVLLGIMLLRYVSGRGGSRIDDPRLLSN